MGFQFLIRDFEAVGEEAFTPPSKTVNWGLFAVEEYHLGDVTLEAGLRYERQSIESPSVSFDRDFDTVSFSAGAGWQLFDDYLLGISLSRTERAPSAEELLSNGAHLATAGYEIGDPTLAKEAGLTIEGRRKFADLRFEAFWVDAQDRVSSFELPTDDYLLLNLILTVHPFPDRRNVTLVVQGRNLLDSEARVHASFLKDRLPLPGREAKVSLQVLF